MSILVDNQINQGLTGTPSLASDVRVDDFEGEKSKVQASSLDLTIGSIYVPGTEAEKPGGAYTPTKVFTLNQGHTAVIKTAEVLNLGRKLAGIAFPPASLSLKGLLMTNPGHIDPGYRGPLHITVINMSRAPFELRAGDRIMRVLFLELSKEPSAPYNIRQQNHHADVIDPALLERLSIDFLDVEKRAEKIASSALKNATYIAAGIPLGVALLALMGNLFASYLPQKDDMRKLDVRLTAVEARHNTTLDERIRKIEDRLLTNDVQNQRK